MKNAREPRARVAQFVGGVIACSLFALAAQGGCAESLPIEFVLEPDGGAVATGGSSNSNTGGDQGSGGSFGTGGDTATGGEAGTGGATGTGGTTGTGGVTGSGGFKATGGASGTGGFGTTGGATGTGGTKATGGTTATGGSAGGAGGSAATFTEVYQMIVSVSCTGGGCHNPGSNGGFSFSSQSTAYSSLKSKVVAGNANSSTFYSVVNSGAMPPGKKLSSTLISLIASWINAGAMNN